MPEEPQLPNPEISIPEVLLVVLMAVVLDFVKFLVAPLPGIDLIGLLDFLTGEGFILFYLFLRVGPSGMLGGDMRVAKIVTDMSANVVGWFFVLGDFVPELTIQSATMFLLLRLENEKARRDFEEAQRARPAPYVPRTSRMAAMAAANDNAPEAANDNAAEGERKAA